MRHRDVTMLLGGAMALPLVAEAQQPATPVIGFLHSGSPDQNVNVSPPFARASTPRALSAVSVHLPE